MFRQCHSFQANNKKGICKKNNILNPRRTSSLKLRFENSSSIEVPIYAHLEHSAGKLLVLKRRDRQKTYTQKRHVSLKRKKNALCVSKITEAHFVLTQSRFFFYDSNSIEHESKRKLVSKLVMRQMRRVPHPQKSLSTVNL